MKPSKTFLERVEYRKDFEKRRRAAAVDAAAALRRLADALDAGVATVWNWGRSYGGPGPDRHHAYVEHDGVGNDFWWTGKDVDG